METDLPEDERMVIDIQAVVEVVVPKGMTKADVVAALAMHSTDVRVTVNSLDIQKHY